MYKFIFLCLGLALINYSCTDPDRELRQQYMNQTLPGNTPQIFGEGIISLKGSIEGQGAFTPDGKQFFFVTQNFFKTLSIMQMSYDGDKWSNPKKASFSDIKYNWEPHPKPDGESVLFISNRPPAIYKWTGRLWEAKRGADGNWMAPQMIWLNLPATEGVWHPTVSASNTVVFSSHNLPAAESVGNSDIYFCTIGQDSSEFKSIGSAVNSAHDEGHPFIAPDESYLIFSSDRPDGAGKLDLYISFKDGNDWSAPQHLGNDINSPADETSPKITPDGKFLLFDRREGQEMDIYWVSAEIIQQLR